MKILFLSDTHEEHEELTNLPKADMIIHGGDITNRGKVQEIDEFIEWFANLDYAYKIFISGNHDFYFEKHTQQEIQASLSDNMYYLCDSGITIEGINIWGSPITPTFFNWAFNRNRGADIMPYWQLIPQSTDILITHGPPYRILDKTKSGDYTGCQDLLEVVNQIKPKYHLFGHIHEGYGIHATKDTTFINACVLDENYQLKNKGVLFEI